MKKLLIISFVITLFFGGIVTSAYQGSIINDNKENESILVEDFDPLVDINITIDILAIRALDEIVCSALPNFYLKIFINEEEFVSPVWNNVSYLYDCWSVSKDVDDNIELVDISIELWNRGSNSDQICDISKQKNENDNGYGVNLFYSLKTGRWHGDDNYVGDVSGYGRLNGCDDGSIYKDENDCELRFDIYQNDFDGDKIPYYMENFVYGTDPEINNLGQDLDNDKIPIEWEHRWGFSPIVWDDHEHLDPDGDSLNNSEEFLTYDFGSDPFRKDVFLELDFMQNGSGGEQIKVPDETFEMIKNPYNRRNIVFHTDVGEAEGGELIPFDNNTINKELFVIYNNFFLHNDSNNWRRGVFHYGIVVYFRKPSMAFSGDNSPHYGYFPGTNSFVISKSAPDFYYNKYKGQKSLAFLYSVSFVHEMGHTFGLRFGKPPGCDNFLGSKWWQPGFWRYGTYKSIMNYRYFFSILDYSDGTHGIKDYDDWKNIDLTYFEKSST
jgi:hypothetical protein